MFMSDDKPAFEKKTFGQTKDLHIDRQEQRGILVLLHVHSNELC